MDLVDGDKAHDSDVWLRVITNNEYIKADGQLHNKAFTGKAFSAPSDTEKKRSWKWELSGRLLSKTVDLQKESLDFCKKINKVFEGLMFQKNEHLRNTKSEFSKDIFYTPIEDADYKDTAHSDFVVFDDFEAIPQEVRSWLQDLLKVAKPTDLDSVNSLRLNSQE